MIKPNRTSLLRAAVVLPFALGGTQAVFAGFQYNARDLVFGFRQDSGSYELVVNAGPVSTLYNLPNGSSVTISSITKSLLTNAFLGDLNNLFWSASADVRTTGDANYPIQTLWVVRPRDDLNTQSTAWNRQSQFAQGNTGAKIDGIANGAVTYGNQVPSDSKNTTTGVVMPAGDQYAYSTFVGTGGNYGNAFQGDVEVTTPPDFEDVGQPLRADLYQLKPGTGAGTYLGYFEFKTNGVMTYTAGASTSALPPRPAITDVFRSGSTTTVSFTTVVGAHYTLLYSTNVTAARSTWTVTGSTIVGDGNEKSIPDNTGDARRFYVISAAP